MTDSDQFVDDIIKDARLIADYGRLSGAFKDDAFFSALADAERVETRTISEPAIVKLQKQLNDAAKLVPFTTFAALHRNWTPRRSSRKSAWMSAFLVALSIIFMAATAQLTYIYNQGTDLLAAVETLQEQDTEQRFGHLVRQMWSAREDPDIRRNIDGNAITSESIYTLDYNLRKLDTTISDTAMRAQDFAFKSTFPLIGMHSAYCLYNRTLAAATQGDRKANLVGCGYADNSYEKLPYAARAQCATSDPGSTVVQTASTGEDITDILDQYEQAALDLFCEGSITNDPKSIHWSLTRQSESIRQTISPYALWILPAMYGALGALMFQMRRILDPLSPNPQFVSLLHRVALGALAGMILAWFLAPDARFGTDVAGIGFGLFSFAFLFGFSIDVFFTVLDEFVAFANMTVRRFGAAKTDAAAQAQSAAGPQRAAPAA